MNYRQLHVRPKSSAAETNELQRVLRMWKEMAERSVYKRGKYIHEYETYKIEDDDHRLGVYKELCQMGADLSHLQKERGFACLPRVFWCEKLMKFFLDRGADVNFADENGDTVLHLTIRNGRFSPTNFLGIKACPKNDTVNVIKFLLRHSANPNLRNARGQTALTLLMDQAGRSTNKNVLEVAEMLVKSGKKYDSSSWKSNGELMLLHGYKHSAIIEHCSKVFGTKIDVDARTSCLEYSKTPLMLAVMQDKRACCRLLIKMGADVNTNDLQGFTALHHAVRYESTECAKLLINAGAEPNAETASGRNCYDLCFYNREASLEISKLGDAKLPAKRRQLEILEIMGVKKILWKRNFGDCITLWDQAMDLCKDEIGLQPSQEFLANYEFIKENRQNPSARREIYHSAMKTVARLSKGKVSKFWNLLSFVQEYAVGWLFAVPNFTHFFDILDFLSEELKSGIGDFASLDEDHFNSLRNVVDYLLNWLKNLIKSGTNSKNELITCEKISHVHSIARLTIACFQKLMHEMGSKTIIPRSLKNPRNLVYVRIYCILTLIHARFEVVISKEAFNDNARLLRSLIGLDLRDGDGNTLLHMILLNKCYMDNNFESDQLCVLLDFVSVQTRNLRGCEPVQFLEPRPDAYLNQDFREFLIKMADMGAHVDARNVRKGSTLAEILRWKVGRDVAFRYDSLQCACARVLARSTVPYVNKVPNHMVDFIRAHCILSRK